VRARKLKKVKKSLLIRLALACAFVYAAFYIVSLQMRIGKINAEIDEYNVKIEAQKAENANLQEMLDSEADDEFIERMARERLGYINPDETVYRDVGGR